MDDVLYLLHDRGEIDDEELLLLVGDRRDNLHTGLPYFKYDRFNIFEMREDECEVEFRFKRTTYLGLQPLCNFLRYSGVGMVWW